MRHLVVVAALAALSTTTIAAAQQEQAAETAPNPQRKICGTEKMTGSLTRRSRICLTEAQWRELNDRTRRGVQELQGSANGGCRTPFDPNTGTQCGG